MPGADRPRLYALKQALAARTSPGPAAGAAALEQGAMPGADKPLLHVFKQALVGSADMLWTCSTGTAEVEQGATPGADRPRLNAFQAGSG